MIEAFDLEPRRVFYRSTLATKPVRMVYRSRTDPRLTVVCKDNGGKADALNCGINFARYRFLCCVDGDTMFAPDAVLKAMTDDLARSGADRRRGELLRHQPHAGDDRRCRLRRPDDERAPARRLPASST